MEEGVGDGGVLPQDEQGRPTAGKRLRLWHQGLQPARGKRLADQGEIVISYLDILVATRKLVCHIHRHFGGLLVPLLHPKNVLLPLAQSS